MEIHIHSPKRRRNGRGVIIPLDVHEIDPGYVMAHGEILVHVTAVCKPRIFSTLHDESTLHPTQQREPVLALSSVCSMMIFRKVFTSHHHFCEYGNSNSPTHASLLDSLWKNLDNSKPGSKGFAA